MSRLDGLRGALSRLGSQPVAIDDTRAGAVLSIVTDLGRGVSISDDRLRAAFRGAKDNAGRNISYVPLGSEGKIFAIISARGVALYDFDWQPHCFSTRQLAQTISELAADPAISGCAIIFDTPGGAVTGTAEASAAIFAARRQKRIVGIIDPLCASAGYWLASQCSRIIAVPSADVGSVGVFMMHTDISKMLDNVGVKPTFIYADASPHKVEGNSYEPLKREAFDYYKSEINVVMNDFLAAIARGRGIHTESVQRLFGGGRTMSAALARQAGMIDAIATPDAAIQMALKPISNIPLNTKDARRRRLKLLEHGYGQ